MKLKHTYLTSSDPAGLSEFYEKMGFEVRFADPGRWIQFKMDGAAFCIASPEESASEVFVNAIAVFEVEHLELMLAQAEKAGALRIGQVRDMGTHGKVAWIEDIGHNIIQFFESPKHQQRAR